jgi:hypothetical protein
MKHLLSILGTLALLYTANAQGTFEAITGYSAGSAVNVFVPGTGGWTFQPQVDMTVTKLGALDLLLSQDTMDIGIWTDDGTELGFASITATDPSSTQPQYASITPISLSAGQTYRIGAFGDSGVGLGMSVVYPAPSTNGSVSLSADLKLGSYVYAPDNSFAFPGILGTSGAMLLGATFLYTKDVPEPSFVALFCLSALGLLAWRTARCGQRKPGRYFTRRR